MQFDTAHTAAGAESPISARLIITDDQTHTLHVGVQNTFGSGGMAWFDDIEIVAPDGKILCRAQQDECCLMAEIDPALTLDKKVTARNDLLIDRRPEYYQI